MNKKIGVAAGTAVLAAVLLLIPNAGHTKKLSPTSPPKSLRLCATLCVLCGKNYLCYRLQHG